MDYHSTQFRIGKTTFGDILIPLGNLGLEHANVFREMQCKGLYANNAFGCQTLNYEILDEFEPLIFLAIVPSVVVTAISRKSLRHCKALSISRACKNLDLSAAHDLGFLDVSVTTDLQGLESLKFLKCVSLRSPSECSFLALRNCLDLEQFNIRLATFATIDLQLWPSLQWLDLYSAPKLKNIQGLRNARSLAQLDFESCKNFDDWDNLSNLPNLKGLKIFNCGKIPTIRWIESLRSLEQLVISGDTLIEDGDISILEDLPNLRQMFVKRRRSYNLDTSEMNNLKCYAAVPDLWVSIRVSED